MTPLMPSDSPATAPDYVIESHGSLAYLTPLDGAVAAVLADILGEECTWSGGSLVVEPRYLDALVDALEMEGFSQ